MLCGLAFLASIALTGLGCKGSGPANPKPAPEDQNAKMMQMQKQMMQSKMGAKGPGPKTESPGKTDGPAAGTEATPPAGDDSGAAESKTE